MLNFITRLIKGEAYWKERLIAILMTATYLFGNGVEYLSGKVTDDPPLVWMIGIVVGLSVIAISLHNKYRHYTPPVFKFFLCYLNFNIAVAYCVSAQQVNTDAGNNQAQLFYLLFSYVLFIATSQGLDSRRELILFTLAEITFFTVAVAIAQPNQPLLMQPMHIFTFGFVMAGNFIIHMQRMKLTQVSFDSSIQFKALSENARDIQSIIDKQMNFVYTNASMKDMAGYKSADVVGKKFLDIVVVQDKDKVHETLAGVIQSPEKKQSVEYRIKNMNGEVLWVETIFSSFKSTPASKDYLVFAETRDVELRKKLEEEIQLQLDAEALLIKHSNNFINLQRTEIKSGIESALNDFGNMLYADAILVYKLQGKLTDEFLCVNRWALESSNGLIQNFNQTVRINQPLVRFLRGYSGDKVTRGGFVDATTLREIEILSKTALTGKKFYLVPLQSGQVTNGIILFVFDENIPSNESGFFGLVGNMIASAFTRQRTELRLHEAQLTNEYILKALPDWLYIVNSAGEFTGSNNYSTLESYLNDSNLIGKSVNDVLPKEIAGKFTQTLAEVIRAEAAISFEYADSSIRKGKFFKAIIAPFKDNEYLIIIRDISDLKLAQNELETKAEKLEISNKELEEFAYVVSHDMKQPIRTIISYLSLLKKKHADQLTDEANEYIAYSIDGANKMSALIKDILQYSRLEQQISFVTEVDLNNTVNAVKNALKDLINTQNVSIECAQLPVIKGNETMIGELFQNLVENGIKYNTSSLKKVKIDVVDKGEMWQFEISDNGIGFEEQYATLIFKIFKRLHSDAEYTGTGIGLSICQKVVVKHGGKIWVQSKKGLGSRFYFTLPK